MPVVRDIAGTNWQKPLHVRSGRKTPRAFGLPGLGAQDSGDGRRALAGMTGSAEMLTTGKVREILHPDWSADRPLPAPEDLAKGDNSAGRWSGVTWWPGQSGRGGYSTGVASDQLPAIAE